MSFLNYIVGRIDKATGLAELSLPNRRRISAEQIRGVVRMAPLGTIGALFAIGVLAFILWNTEVRLIAMIVLGAIAAMQLLTMRTYFAFKKNLHKSEVGTRAVRKVAFSGALFGLLWGAAGYLAVVHSASEQLFIVGLLLGGILLTTMYCFRTVFIGALTFIGVSGLLLGAAFIARDDLMSVQTAALLLSAYLILLPRLAFNLARDFNKHAVAEIKSLEDAKVSNELLRQFEEAGNEWFWATDPSGYLERASDELRTILANINPDFLDANKQIRLADCDSDNTTSLSSKLKTNGYFSDVRVKAVIGNEFHWLSFSGRATSDEAGQNTGYVGVCSDVTKEKITEQKIVEMAKLDGLTGLHNRTYFYDTLDSIVRRLERYGSSFTLMFLDLDKFKLVNDTYGHQVGDGVLIQAAERINKVVRGNDIVGRLGGDEFAIIIEETCDPVFIAKLATRIIQEVSAPYHVNGETLYIGVSVGVAMAPMHGTQREQLLRNADLALYRAKEDGRGVFRYFEAQMDFQQRERRMLEQEMRTALTENEFEMKFQPMISTKSGKVSCMEALIRWNHEIRGLLSPDEFISIAEQSNLIIEVGRWSLRSACTTALSWPESVDVAVNISALHFTRSDIVQDVSTILDETGLAPHRLEVEITESILIEDNDDTVTKLNGLRELGVTIAMDDFGTGYSSLGYLTKFRFDRLKIDKSFLLDMEENEDRKAIIYAISTLGENLDIDITVEGVETIEHVEFLKTIYCDQAQGYYYSRPMDAGQVSAFLLKTFAEAISSRNPGENSLITDAVRRKNTLRTAKVA